MIIALVGLISVHTSCSRYYYQPNAVNTPMLKEKGDMKVAISGSSSKENLDGNYSKSSLLNIQTAYSPIKYMGVMANFSNYKYSLGEENFAEGDVDAHASLFEVGAGGYYPIFLKDNGLGLVADTYIGYGGGKLKSDVNMNFNRLFIQPGISLTFPYFDVGLAARISGIKYSNLDPNGMSAEYISNQGLNTITEKRHYFFEPALTLRGGYKFIKAELQVTSSDSFKDLDWEYDGNIVSLGVYFSIEEAMKWGKKKDK